MEKVKIKVSKTSDWNYKETFEFQTLQDFLNVVKNLEELMYVILSYDKQNDCFSMMIYDECVD